MKALRGFSLIELIIGMVIFGVLLSIAIPAFTNWLRNARVRTAAESVQNGLQLARAEAVRRNTPVYFSLVATGNDCERSLAGPNWVVSLDSPFGLCAPPDPATDPETAPPRIIQSRNGAEDSAATTVAAKQAAFLFNSLGRPIKPPTEPSAIVGDGATDFSSPTAGCMKDATPGPVRCLRVVVSVGGQIRMCDPALPSGDAQGSCP